MKRESALHIVKPEPEPVTPPTPATSQLWRDKNWKYTRSEATDIARTFARVKRELAAQNKQPQKGRTK